jgi:hypothetical protein
VWGNWKDLPGFTVVALVFKQFLSQSFGSAFPLFGLDGHTGQFFKQSTV